MMPSRGMGDINPAKIPRAKRRGDDKPVIGTGKPIRTYSKGGKTKSKVNEAGNYTKPGMRKKLFESIKASGTHGTKPCLLYTSPSPRDRTRSRMPSSA